MGTITLFFQFIGTFPNTTWLCCMRCINYDYQNILYLEPLEFQGKISTTPWHLATGALFCEMGETSSESSKSAYSTAGSQSGSGDTQSQGQQFSSAEKQPLVRPCLFFLNCVMICHNLYEARQKVLLQGLAKLFPHIHFWDHRSCSTSGFPEPDQWLRVPLG